MRGIRTIRSSDAHRVRRWDVVMLGAALPGLVAAVRLGQRGARVLVLEEAAWQDAFWGLREPFSMTSPDPSGVLGSCLRALGLPLIDQRRFTTDDVALQVVTREARIEWGRAPITASELTAWGLCKPEPGRALLRALEGAAEVEADAMLEAPIVHTGQRHKRIRADGSPTQTTSYARGLPPEAVDPPLALHPVLGGLVRALSDLGETAPAPEARARLLGGLLVGAATLGGRDGGLRGLLRRRIATLFGEFRALDDSFELVSIANQPGVAAEGRDEIFSGRVLVLNAPAPALADALAGNAPSFLRGATASAERVALHYRTTREMIPEGMGTRLVCIPRGDEKAEQRVVRLRVLPGGPRTVDVIASAVAPPSASGDPAFPDWIDRVTRSLIPFADESLVAVETPCPIWDRDDLLVDGAPHGSWPSAGEIRVLGRPAIFALDRGITSGLGFEGDLLLGWRAGDAIADELP